TGSMCLQHQAAVQLGQPLCCVVRLRCPAGGGLPCHSGGYQHMPVYWCGDVHVFGQEREVEPRYVGSRLVPVDQGHMAFVDEYVARADIAVIDTLLIGRHRPPCGTHCLHGFGWHCVQTDVSTA